VDSLPPDAAEPLELRIESAASPSARLLIQALDAAILERYPGLPVNGLEPEFDAEGGVFLVAYSGGRPAGCGALRREGDAAEIKRMYVADGFRRRGVARALLRRLEAEARGRGFSRAILETGIHQPEAIALYRSEGWRRIPPYGIYVNEPVSVCFGKSLG
jgi:GNAT superfamily N-acetyltransferase